MTISQRGQDFEQVVEKIVFDEEELEQLKIAIKKISEGKMQAKQLKQKLLQSRGRIVNDISQFLSFCIERIKNEDLIFKDENPPKNNQLNQNNMQLQQEISEKNEILKVVANRVSNIVDSLKKN